MMRRFVALGAGVIGLAAVVLVITTVSRRSTAPSPSIVLIVVDTLRPDYLGAYGFEGDISRNLDRLASESLQFTEAFSAAPWTNPSMASLFTSLHPSAHGVTYHRRARKGLAPEETGVLPEAALTLAESLRAAGYRTGAFQANPWLSALYGYAQGFERYLDCQGRECPSTEDMLGAAHEWLRSLGRGQRYFLYLHLMDVHAPYSGTPRDFRRLLGNRSLGESHRLTEAERRAIPWDTRLLGREERRWRQAWRAKYAAGVRAMDRRLGGFLDQLRRGEGYDEPLIVFTSDHGEELAEHGGWDHGRTLFEEQIRVPLLIRLPGGRPSGRRQEMVNLLDLMPTLLAAAAAPVPATLQGRVIRLDDRPEIDGAAVSLATATQTRPGLNALRTPTHKLIVDLESEERWLYDLQTDRQEQHDLAAAQPALVRALDHRLSQLLKTAVAHGKLAVETKPLSDSVREKLKSLGYVE